METFTRKFVGLVILQIFIISGKWRHYCDRKNNAVVRYLGESLNHFPSSSHVGSKLFEPGIEPLDVNVALPRTSLTLETCDNYCLSLTIIYTENIRTHPRQGV